MFDLLKKADLKFRVENITDSVEQQIRNRTFVASSEIRNTLLDEVLKGERSGKRYKMPHSKQYYTASAAGEAPAVRTGAFRISFHESPRVKKVFRGLKAYARVESGLHVGKYLLGDLLEKGTRKMKPRPYKQKTIEKALPKVEEIFNRPYV